MHSKAPLSTGGALTPPSRPPASINRTVQIPTLKPMTAPGGQTRKNIQGSLRTRRWADRGAADTCLEGDKRGGGGAKEEKKNRCRSFEIHDHMTTGAPVVAQE